MHYSRKNELGWGSISTEPGGEGGSEYMVLTSAPPPPHCLPKDIWKFWGTCILRHRARLSGSHLYSQRKQAKYQLLNTEPGCDRDLIRYSPQLLTLISLTPIIKPAVLNKAIK